MKVHRHRTVLRHLSLGLSLVAVLSLCPGFSTAEPGRFEQLVRTSDLRTLTEWAKRYEAGIEVSRNIDRAIQLYCKAARMGDVHAQYELGRIYALGRAGKRNDVLAAGWLAKAANQDHRRAQTMLKSLGPDGVSRRGKAKCVLSKELRVQTLGRKSPGRTVRSPARQGHTANRKQVADMVNRLAPQYGLSAKLVLSVIQVESGFNPQAVSPKNARGLMQLMPATAARFGVKDVWDPEQNLRGGMAYLSWLMKQFRGNLHLTLAAYNAGEEAVHRHGGVPPYEETRNYVRRITQRLHDKSERSVVASRNIH
jgi:hypothetical protein